MAIFGLFLGWLSDPFVIALAALIVVVIKKINNPIVLIKGQPLVLSAFGMVMIAIAFLLSVASRHPLYEGLTAEFVIGVILKLAGFSLFILAFLNRKNKIKS